MILFIICLAQNKTYFVNGNTIFLSSLTHSRDSIYLCLCALKCVCACVCVGACISFYVLSPWSQKIYMYIMLINYGSEIPDKKYIFHII